MGHMYVLNHLLWPENAVFELARPGPFPTWTFLRVHVLKVFWAVVCRLNTHSFSFSSLLSKAIWRRYWSWLWRRKERVFVDILQKQLSNEEHDLWEGLRVMGGWKVKVRVDWKCWLNWAERCKREEGREPRLETEKMYYRILKREICSYW